MFYFLFLTNFLRQKVCYEELKFSLDKTLITDTDWPVKTTQWPVITDHRPLFAALLYIYIYIYIHDIYIYIHDTQSAQMSQK